MEPVRKAVWYIEGHFADAVSLDDLAEVAGLSRFHLSRTFAQVTGSSVSAYLRGRRLTEAARKLAQSDDSILDVALAFGYGSHEAFTRAFRDVFSVTPETVRKQRALENLNLMEPFIMADTPSFPLSKPDIREEGPFLMAGIREFRTFDERAGIPGQWQRFGPHMGTISGQKGGEAYGVCLKPASGEEGFDYLTAVEVSSLDDMPEGLAGARIDRHRYAVFTHDDHVSTIGATCAAIFSDWLPSSGRASSDSPVFLMERYGEDFDPMTGRGGIEVWIPLKE